MEPPDPLGLLGQTLRGSWRAERLVHVGTLSHVYEARRVTDGRKAVIKCYVGLSELPEGMRDNVRETFIRVGREVARIARTHDGVVRPLGGGWVALDGGAEIPCIILEWLKGTTLEALLDREGGRFRRTAGEVLTLMEAPMAALAAAHRAGLVHRDIKPSNFYVDGDAIEPGVRIRILDLSLAKPCRTPEDSVPRRNVLFMTPHYAAPEQFRGDDPMIGPWTDVFGLALVLTELMASTGPALPGETIASLREASEDRESRPTPRSLGLDVPNAVEAVFRRALAVDVSERFADAGAFVRSLRGAVSADGRVTSSAISRVSGILTWDPHEDLPRRLIQPPIAAPGPRVHTEDEPLVTPPIITGHTVLAKAPEAGDG